MPGTRASLSISAPNERWIQNMIDCGEFASRSEVVNDLIRRAREKNRETDYIRTKLIRAEQGGFVDKTPEEMLEGFKDKARKNGQL